MSAVVLDPGFTTVQDLGRDGFGSHGVPPSGAMDPWALRAANRLCGNDDGAAGLEFTLAGPALRFAAGTLVALTGSEFEASLDGTTVPWWESLPVPAGATFRLGKATGGARGYLAVAGGIDVPVVLGSRSTHLGASFGGHGGVWLAKGDRLEFNGAAGPRRRMRSEPNTPVLRVLDGPHREWTGGDLCEHAFTVSSRSDRVGVRLDGPVLPRRAGEIDPEPTVTGAVQLPPDGHPIVLGPDRGVTGGYPVIAAVIAADCGLLAHARPGDTLRFVRTSIEEARNAWRERERALEEGITEWT